VAISADISVAKDIDRALQEAITKQGEIDILIANAGTKLLITLCSDLYEQDLLFPHTSWIHL
jgi:short-subunit dehydrogenase